MSDELDRLRREIHAVLQPPGVRPDDSLEITRRTFIHKSLLFGAATVGQTFAWWPLLNTIDVANAAEAPFKFAWISDTHLYPRSLNTRFVDKTVRAVQDVQAMDPPADFLIFGGDLAQLGEVEELELGVELLKEVTIPKHFIPGEHDWYLDMGKKWMELFGQRNWTFDHKGVRFIGLDTVGHGPDYWTAKNMTPEERMGHMSALDGTVAGPWAGVGREQLDWMEKTLSDWGNGQAGHHLQPQSALRILSALELLGARLARSARGAEALHQGHQHPRPRAPGALQRDRHHALDRHAGDLLAVALCAGGRAEAHQADDPCRSGRSVRRRRLGQDRTSTPTTRSRPNTSCGAARRSSSSRRRTTTRASRRSSGRASSTTCIRGQIHRGNGYDNQIDIPLHPAAFLRRRSSRGRRPGRAGLAPTRIR